jgi:anti-sigma-K factor RskA
MSEPADMTPDEPDMTAAELALGVLDGEAYDAAAVRLANDDAFAAEVAAWEARLTPLAAEVAPIAAPDAVWPRIAELIAAPTVSRSGGVWNSLPFWRGATVAGLAAAAAALVVVLSPAFNPTEPAGAPPPASLQPIQVALLAPAAGKPASVVASLDPNSHELVLISVSLTVPAKTSPELWVIPQGGDPISLGVMDPAKPYRIPMPAALAGAGLTTAKLAVTAEQAGGSPDGKPHGPIVTVGAFT